METQRLGLADRLLLPLKWVERSKGWKRRGLMFLYFWIFLFVSAIGWRQLHLLRLPDLREPFDEAKYGTVRIAESDNALPLYEAANTLLKPQSLEVSRVPFKNWDFMDWNKLDPLLKRYAIDNQPALDLWIKAADRRDFLLIQPNQIRDSTSIDQIVSVRNLARLAMFRASEKIAQDDFAGAWNVYRAVLRSSRHVGLHGVVNQRIIGNVILSNAQIPISAWIENPGTTSAMLKQAIRDVEVCQAMTPPISEMVRMEYFVSKDLLSQMETWGKYDVNGPDGAANWYVHVPGVVQGRHFLLREPERSQRILRLITAGILAQSDRPRWARPPLASKRFMIYQIDSRTPPAVASISAEALAGWAESSGYSTIAYDLDSFVMTKLEAEDAIFDTWRLRMAERAYQIDHGKPPKTHADLLGAYLEQLPEGIEPSDPVGTPSVSQ
jgi:hypothetical protein